MVCLHFPYEHRACICLSHLSHSPLSRTLFVTLTLWCHVLISITPLYFSTLSSTFASFNILCAFPPLCFLATPVSGDAPFLATRTLGDAYVWHSWRRVCLGTPVATSNLCLLSLYPLVLHFEWEEDKKLRQGFP